VEGDEGQTVSFSPEPDWAKTSRIFEVAAVSLATMSCTDRPSSGLAGCARQRAIVDRDQAVPEIVMWGRVGRWGG